VDQKQKETQNSGKQASWGQGQEASRGAVERMLNTVSAHPLTGSRPSWKLRDLGEGRTNQSSDGD
jgi:hypothetical protein